MQNRIQKASNFNALYAATNPIVTNQAMEFFQSADGFVAVRDVPLIRVPNASGKLAVVKQEYINRDDVKLRSSSPAEAQKISLGVGTVDYETDSRAVEAILTAEDAAKIGYEYGMDVPSLIPRALGMKANIHTEVRLSALWASGSWYRTVTGNANDSGSEGTTTMNRKFWADAAANPATAIAAEKRIFLLRTGLMPTNLRLGYRLFETLATHPLIRAQIALTIGGSSQTALYTPMASVAQLSALFGLKVSVSWGIKNTSEIDGTPTNEFIVNQDDALMTYDTPGTFDATLNKAGEASVAMTGSTGFARVAWNGVASATDGMMVRHVDRPTVGAGGSQSWIMDLWQGYVIVDSKFGTFFDGMVA